MTFGPLGRMLLLATKVTAIIGGLMFVALVVMSIVTIIGRKLFSAPVPGDVEMLQICAAVASSTFFAYCHLNGGDVKVDFFTPTRPATVHRLDTFGSLLVGVFGALIAWRTAAATLTLKAVRRGNDDPRLPQWWGPLLMVPGFALMGLAGFYMVTRHARARWRRGGRREGRGR